MSARHRLEANLVLATRRLRCSCLPTPSLPNEALQTTGTASAAQTDLESQSVFAGVSGAELPLADAATSVPVERTQRTDVCATRHTHAEGKKNTTRKPSRF